MKSGYRRNLLVDRLLFHLVLIRTRSSKVGGV
jgi:hypothetical protein